ncbi:TPA: hypothetical protein N0F65_011062 [Lagenidium giganteum]|uniref:Uncharacterized protein n=1 Tax=Lagenidium giganteum TaxID=4803 RepID=A0AAV2ZI81_9STRA|nr:TPA: hypothetical protein N0F65_011062 [Lagenidium giganteum]
MCLCGLTHRSQISDQGAVDRSKLPTKSAVRPRRKNAHHHHARREWHDGLLFSNLIYVLAALLSYSSSQYFCAVFQMGAAIASTLFHRSKETRYLLVDAIISSSLAVLFIYVACHTIKQEWYGILAVKLVQGAMCIFTWVYCGFPGGERYEKWHQLWHYVSGCTTMSTTLFLTWYMPEFDFVLHELVQDYIAVKGWMS